MKKFKPGIEVFFSSDFPGKFRVAAVTNHTGRTRNGDHLVNLLANHESFELVRIFTPEHGFTSDAPDGEHVADSKHEELAVPVISLYGPNKKPAKELISDIDALIYDIQDVGVRFYTYISTLRNIIDAAAESEVAVWILDRPDVLGGFSVEGPMLQEGFSSFVSHLPVPIRYGLTPGELALWWKNKNSLNVEIKIWKCADYCCYHKSEFPDFPWFQPSPSMPDVKTALFYPGTCLFEGTQVSEGRGSDAPFRNIGAPWIDARRWLDFIKPLLPAEIKVVESRFVPAFSKYEGYECSGIRFDTDLPYVDNAVYIGVAAIYSLMQTHPGKVRFEGRPGLEKPFLDYLCGTDEIRKGLLNNEEPHEIIQKCKAGVEEFAKERKRFFLYPRN
ncbi:MAG: DUF1343 domain-containing protein [Candidatus Rifleibacteriota bacterium]